MEEMNKKPKYYKQCERDIQRLPISALKMLGMWHSNDWSFFIKMLHLTMRLFVFSGIIVDLITAVVKIILSEDPAQTFLQISFYVTSISCTLWKASCVVIRHEKIVLLLKMLVEDPCIPRDSDEIAIHNKTDSHSRWVFKLYVSITLVALAAFLVAPVIKSGDERIGALYTYRPFDLKVPFFFWITYVQQGLTRSAMPFVHISVECLIAGLLQQACAQIKILQHRLRKMPELVAKYTKQKKYKHVDIEYILFTQNVRHHIHILQFAKLLNGTFVEILFVQCLLSMAFLSFSVYEISTHSIFSAYFINALLFNVCMMIQLFLFCFYGNELMLQSTKIKETLFETDWASLRKDTKSNIFTMMICTTKPIVISATSVIKIDLSSFIFIINASYSAFNVLQQAAK